MPPKKKPKTVHVADVPARTIDQVPPLLYAVQEWIEKVYALRHKTEKDASCMDFPVLHGGTFKASPEASGAKQTMLEPDRLSFSKLGH